METKQKAINRYCPITYFLFVLLISGCTYTKVYDYVSILEQLPDDGRVILVPNDFINISTSNYNLLSFNNVGSSNNEEEFYLKAQSLGVQYIIISSDMIEVNNQQFPWMLNKNFKVCPGLPDKNTESYFVLLVWDNTKNSYHFFKFIYENQE